MQPMAAHSPTRRRRLQPIPLLIAALLLAACVEESRPSGCDEDEVEIAVELTATTMTPSAPAACRDQAITLLVTSEVDAVFHIHGYDDSVPATEIAADATTSIEFVAERAGQFPIEIHPAEDPQGVEVGILTVHAP
jgi:hypothetical protein